MATAADIYAQAQSDALKKQLQNLYTNQQNTYQGLTASNDAAKQQLLNEILKQEGGVENTYQANSNQAYIAKMLSDKTLQGNLNRMGLDNSGFGVGQSVANANVYGTNLKDLQTAKQTSLDTLNTNKTNLNLTYAQKAAELAASNSSANNDITKYINEVGTDEYNNAYSRYLNQIQTNANVNEAGGGLKIDDNTPPPTGTPTATVAAMPKKYNDYKLSDSGAKVKINGTPVAIQKGTLAGAKNTYVYWDGTKFIPLTLTQRKLLGLK